MKKIIILTIISALAYSGKAQVIIGKDTPTNDAVSVEFADDEPRGMILPYVETVPSGPTPGTIIFDTTDKKVKYWNSTAWVLLSDDDSTPATIGVVDLSIQTTRTESSTAKTAIGNGADTDTTTGILVLTDPEKAMILPKLNKPYETIVNPAPGMMVYDTESHQLAVFNGTVWSFWKP